MTARPINHFVIRNGKMISKDDAQKLLHTQNGSIITHQPPKLNIIKPAATINVSCMASNNANRISNTGKNAKDQFKCGKKGIEQNNSKVGQKQNVFSLENLKEIGKLCEFYQAKIKKYQERIIQLQKQIFNKDSIINKLNKQKFLENQGFSTARDSRQSRSSAKQNHQHQDEDQKVGCAKQRKLQLQLKLKENPLLKKDQIVKQLQKYFPASKKQQNDKNSIEYETQSKIIQASSSSSRKYSLQNQIQQKPVQLKQIQQIQGLPYSSISDAATKQNIDSVADMPSLNSIQSATSICSAQQLINCSKNLQQRKSKTFFDTSTLMARLNKSASLVRNIKKFLQPTKSGNSPKSAQEQGQQSSQPVSQRVFKQQEQQVNCGRDQMQSFIDELLQKHEKILSLMQILEKQKDQQIKEIKRYYQDYINSRNMNTSSNGFIINQPQQKMIHCDSSSSLSISSHAEQIINGIRNSASTIQKIRQIKNNSQCDKNLKKFSRNRSSKSSLKNIRSTKKFVEVQQPKQETNEQVKSVIENKQNMEIIEFRAQFLQGKEDKEKVKDFDNGKEAIERVPLQVCRSVGKFDEN